MGDNNGMLFNNRRVSSDWAVTEDIIRMVSKEVESGRKIKLWMNGYSSRLFENDQIDSCVSEMFLQEAGRDDYCFVENVSLQEYENKIQTVVLYRWNRKYPADLRFTMDLSEWTLKEQIEFQGHSHEKITKEVYFRGK